MPRSFIGPLLLAGVSQTLVAVLGFHRAQFVVRAVLGLFNAGCLVVFARGVRRAFGEWAGCWFVMLLCSQFHVMFYASRTLPNMFAFGLSELLTSFLLLRFHHTTKVLTSETNKATLAFSFLLPPKEAKEAPRRQRLAITLLVFSAIIFRAELAILLGTTGLYLLLTGQTNLINLIQPFIISSFVALAVSVPIDSYFWQKPLWPELWGFYFNAILGSSSDWGVSPWHYYFTSAIPRIILNPYALLVLIPLAVFYPATSRAARSLLVPSLLFVAIYSIQPHKETRFIFYVSPPLTAAASLGASTLSLRAAKSTIARLMTLTLVLSVLATTLASSAMLLFSSLNYPGGDALSHLADVLANDPRSDVSVHADVFTCMTGLTLFTTNPYGVPYGSKQPNGVTVRFDKTEDEETLKDPEFWNSFDYLLVETGTTPPSGSWETLAVVEGLSGLEILKPRDVDPHDAKVRGHLVGKGEEVAWLRHWVRQATGGWWVGPRMVPRIKVLGRRESSGAKPSGSFGV